MNETIWKTIRNLLIVFSAGLILWLVADTSYEFGRIECQLDMIEGAIPQLDSPAPSQEIKFPTDSELFDRFIQCRKDLTELAEANNTNINCHDRTCSRE